MASNDPVSPDTDPESERTASRRDAFVLAAILLLTSAVYARALWNGFTYDDRHYVSAYTLHGPNPMIVDDHPIGDFFEKPMGYGVQPQARGFRPLTVLSYAFTHRLARSEIRPPRPHPEFPETRMMQEWEDPAWPHHLLNLMLHLVGVVLVYRVLRLFATPARPLRLPALGAAAVFALHALHSDPVISIVGRGELLPFVAGMAGTLLYVGGLDRQGPPRWGRWIGVGCLMLAAFLSKESAIAWVVMTPLIAAARAAQRGVSLPASLGVQWRGWVVAVVVPAAMFFLLRANMLAQTELAEDFTVAVGNNELFHLGFFDRLPTAVKVWGYGLYKVFVPYPLACDYGRKVFAVVGYGDLGFWSAALALLSLLAVGLWGFRREPLVFLGAAAFLGFGFITSNIPVPIETIFGERLFYTPVLLASCLAAVWLVRSPRIAVVGLSAWLLASATVCVLRTVDWSSNETLFAADADGQPRSLGLQMNMARVCRLRGDFAGRQRYLERALAVDENCVAALNDRAADLMEEREFVAARPLLERAVAELVRLGGLDLQSKGPEALMNLGIVAQRVGDEAAARRSFARVLEIAPRRGGVLEPLQATHDAYLWLMRSAHLRGDAEDLAAKLGEAGKLFTRDPELALYGGVLAADRGDPAAALRALDPLLGRLPESDHTLVGHQVSVSALRSVGPAERVAPAEYRWAQSLHAQGMSAAARPRFESAARDPEVRLDAWRGLLWTLWNLGDLAAIDQVMAEVRAASPGTFDPARIEAASKDPEPAEWVALAGLRAHAAGDFATSARLLSVSAPRLPRSMDALRGWYAFADSVFGLSDFTGARRICSQFLGSPAIPLPYQKKFHHLWTRIEAGDRGVPTK